MRGVVHFFVVAGLTIAAIQGAFWALDAFNVDLAAGFGWDDVLLGTFTAAGVTLGMMVVRPLLKAA